MCVWQGRSSSAIQRRAKRWTQPLIDFMGSNLANHSFKNFSKPEISAFCELCECVPSRGDPEVRAKERTQHMTDLMGSILAIKASSKQIRGVRT